MNIFGFEVTEDQQRQALDRMMSGPFAAKDIQALLEAAGVPEWSSGDMPSMRDPIAMRATDRIIQRERKSGSIQFINRQWHWVGYNSPSTPGAVSGGGIPKKTEGSVVFGCHVEHENGEPISPDCVLDYDAPGDCSHCQAKRIQRREECEHWKPIKVVGAPPKAVAVVELTDAEIVGASGFKKLSKAEIAMCRRVIEAHEAKKASAVA